MPVVNGTWARPASARTCRRTFGSLSGEPKCGAPLLGEQPLGGRLEHHAHGRGDRLQPLEVLPVHDPGVEVREQAGLLEDQDRHRPDVGERVVVAVRVQPLPGLPPARLGAVAEGEEGFLAAEGGALPGDLEHLVRAEVEAVQPARDGREGAVPAAVPAQPGQRDEDLLGVGDDPRPPGRRQSRVPGAGREAEQRAQVVAARVQQDRRFGLVERLAVGGPGQRPARWPPR